MNLIEIRQGLYRKLVAQYGTSNRQVYGYIYEAQRIGDHNPILESSIALTVELVPNPTQRLRHYSKKSGYALSEAVTRALEAFMRKNRGRGKKQGHNKTDQA